MTKVNGRQSLPALDNSKSVKNPDLLNIADKNYAATILKYAGLATKFPQLETNAKTLVGAINEIKDNPSYELPPATTATLGGVIVGSGLKVTSTGVISSDGVDIHVTTITIPPTGWSTVPASYGVYDVYAIYINGYSPRVSNVIFGPSSDGPTAGDIDINNPKYFAEAQITGVHNKAAGSFRLRATNIPDKYISITFMCWGTDGYVICTGDAGAGGESHEYFSGTLTTIDNQNKINVNMTKSTPSAIAQESEENPNVLFFTEGEPGGYMSGDPVEYPILNIPLGTLKLYTEQYISNIAANIQTINDSSDTYTTQEMSTALQDIRSELNTISDTINMMLHDPTGDTIPLDEMSASILNIAQGLTVSEFSLIMTTYEES